MILHACYTAAIEGRIACLADLSGHLTRPGTEFMETLNEMLNNILALLVSTRDERLDGSFVSNERPLKVALDAMRWAAQKQALNMPTSSSAEHNTHS